MRRQDSTVTIMISLISALVPASGIQIVSSTQLVVVTPAVPASAVALTVSSNGQSAVFPGFVFAVPDATRATLNGLSLLKRLDQVTKERGKEPNVQYVKSE